MIKITDKWKWERTKSSIGTCIFLGVLALASVATNVTYHWIKDFDFMLSKTGDLYMWVISIGVQIAIMGALYTILHRLSEYVEAYKKVNKIK